MRREEREKVEGEREKREESAMYYKYCALCIRTHVYYIENNLSLSMDVGCNVRVQYHYYFYLFFYFLHLSLYSRTEIGHDIGVVYLYRLLGISSSSCNVPMDQKMAPFFSLSILPPHKTGHYLWLQ